MKQCQGLMASSRSPAPTFKPRQPHTTSVGIKGLVVVHGGLKGGAFMYVFWVIFTL